MEYKHNKALVPYAKNLRTNMTEEERKLWYCFLKEYPIRFLRQKILYKYIADFYCPQAKLVIELDGSQHYEDEGLRNDEKRNEFLESKGITVVHIANNQIYGEFRNVCEYIDLLVKEKLNQSDE